MIAAWPLPHRLQYPPVTRAANGRWGVIPGSAGCPPDRRADTRYDWRQTMYGDRYQPVPYRYGQICDTCWLASADIVGVDHPDHGKFHPVKGRRTA